MRSREVYKRKPYEQPILKKLRSDQAVASL